MTYRFSTGLKNGLLVDNPLKGMLEGDNGDGFWIDVYTGSRPTSPDNAATGTLLLTYSVGGAGAGLHLADTASSGKLKKSTTEAWAGAGVTNGVAGWFRIRTNDDTGKTNSTTAIRADGEIAATGGELTLSPTLEIIQGGTRTISAFAISVLTP